jgi:hypothetical protein
VHSDAYNVGAALAYLVRRMETFCGVSGPNVLFYKSGHIGGIPRRMPAVDVIRAQANYYRVHRHLYPDEHREILDASCTAVTSDPESIAVAVDGFTDTLSTVTTKRS